jgi:hypothetical protein
MWPGLVSRSSPLWFSPGRRASGECHPLSALRRPLRPASIRRSTRTGWWIRCGLDVPVGGIHLRSRSHPSGASSPYEIHAAPRYPGGTVVAWIRLPAEVCERTCREAPPLLRIVRLEQGPADLALCRLRVARDGVHLDTRVAQCIDRLSRPPHHVQVEVTGEEDGSTGESRGDPSARTVPTSTTPESSKSVRNRVASSGTSLANCCRH